MSSEFINELIVSYTVAPFDPKEAVLQFESIMHHLYIDRPEGFLGGCTRYYPLSKGVCPVLFFTESFEEYLGKVRREFIDQYGLDVKLSTITSTTTYDTLAKEFYTDLKRYSYAVPFSKRRICLFLQDLPIYQAIEHEFHVQQEFQVRYFVDHIGFEFDPSVPQIVFINDR